jgi:S1-C subfamily serine protease
MPALTGLGLSNPPANIREVKVRDGLFENEKSVIELYKRVKPSVVNVTSITVQRDVFGRNLQRIPKGMGTGFVWDKDAAGPTQLKWFKPGYKARFS